MLVMMMRSTTCTTTPNWKHQYFLYFTKTSTFKLPLITRNVCKMSNSYCMSTTSFALNKKRRQLAAVYGAKKKRKKKKKANWWSRFFQDYDDEIWSNWSAEDVLAGDDDDDDDDESNDSFESWKRKAEAISELREAQEDARNAEGREWEDWLQQLEGSSSPPSDPTTASSSPITNSSWDQTNFEQPKSSTNNIDDELMQDNYDLAGFIRKNIYSNRDNDDSDDDDDANDDELLFEDRVFQYASTSSAKFVALLILIPWVIDFLVHDYILMPFLDRYVKTVPLAAEMLDVRRSQKLEIVKSLKLEKGRYRLEMEIGKSPPLSDEEVWLELRHKAIELRDEWRLENRRAFANIWSDMLYGISLFILIYSNKSKVALLKFTGYKLINNVSDTGKAFLIILITDIFLGYHSEYGWEALVEIILEHYGLDADPAAVTIFICSVPVVIDACVKLWLFKYLPRLSPNVTNIFREMERH